MREKIICYCNNVSEKTLLSAMANGANTIERIGQITNAGICKDCKEKNLTGKCCIPEFQKILNNNESTPKNCCC